MRRSQTLSGLSSSVKNTLKTAIAAGLAATFEDSQEAEEQEWDEAKVSGATLSLFMTLRCILRGPASRSRKD